MEHPRLKKLLDSGDIWIENGDTYLAITDYDETVQIGTVGEENNIERYLESYPTPSDW